MLYQYIRWIALIFVLFILAAAALVSGLVN